MPPCSNLRCDCHKPFDAAGGLAPLTCCSACNPSSTYHHQQCIGCLDGHHIRMCPARTLPAAGPLGDWIQTRTGARYWPLDPLPEDVHLEDVASALSKLCRYTGHSSAFYSVAQHSVLVSRLVEPDLALEGLFHDGSEAYLCDVARPVKHLGFMAGYRQVEKLNERAIRLRFNLPLLESPGVKLADRRLLQTEALQLMAPLRAEWTVDVEPFPDLRIAPLSPDNARHLFLARYRELTSPGMAIDPPELCVLCGVEPRVGTGLMCPACGLKATATVARKGKTP